MAEVHVRSMTLCPGDRVQYSRGFGVVVALRKPRRVVVEHETGRRDVVGMLNCIYLPSPEEIERETALIRRSWDDPQLRTALGLLERHSQYGGRPSEPCRVIRRVAVTDGRRRNRANAVRD